jgi:glycosyltransferase involved in cell wall biosynthesis
MHYFMDKILFLGRFAPPMHGAARMNELYYDYLNRHYQMKKIKINYSSKFSQIGKFNIMKFFGIFIVFFKLIWQLFFFKPSLIYFEIAQKGIAFYRDSFYVLICKIFRKKIIFSIHGREVGSKYNKYNKFIFKNAKTIVLSEVLYPTVKNFIDKSDVYFLGNGIEDEIYNHEAREIFLERKKNKKMVLLYLSNMMREKGALDALDFCAKLKKKKIDFECFFVGAFSDVDFGREWTEHAKMLGVRKECKYLGAKYGKDKREILAKANFLIFPTFYKTECYPLVILEAFMFGIPVLSYNTGAIKKIISKDFLGCASKKKDVDDFFKYLKKGDVKDWEKIRNYFKKNYTIEISGRDLKKIVEGELNG